MKKFISEIDGRMRVVTKTGRVARDTLPLDQVSPGVCSMVLKQGEITHLEVDEVNKVGKGTFRHWVAVSNLYEVTG